MQYQVFIGRDPRQPLSYNVMRQSVERHASKPIPITALILDQLPITRQGATEFTFSRFLCPYLSGYEGLSLFCDEDQVVTGDVFELFEYAETLGPDWSMACMQNQPRFEWPSVMLFNNAQCKILTPEYVENTENSLYGLEWAEKVETFPDEWNHCVGYQEPKEAKLYHYTQGIPYWPECRGLPEDKHWFDEYKEMVKSVEWIDLHRNTKHFGQVMKRMLARYGIKAQVHANQ